MFVTTIIHMYRSPSTPCPSDLLEGCLAPPIAARQPSNQAWTKSSGLRTRAAAFSMTCCRSLLSSRRYVPRVPARSECPGIFPASAWRSCASKCGPARPAEPDRGVSWPILLEQLTLCARRRKRSLRRKYSLGCLARVSVRPYQKQSQAPQAVNSPVPLLPVRIQPVSVE